MLKPTPKFFAVAFLVLALALGAWAQSPFMARQTGTGTQTATTAATGQVGATPAVSETATQAATQTAAPTYGTQKQLMDYLSSFTLDITTVNASNVSASERAFLDEAFVVNSAEMQMMQLCLRKERNSDIRGLVQMILKMHQSDDALFIQLETAVGGSATPMSFSRVPILPGTPTNMLGFNWIDLNAVFVNGIRNNSGTSGSLACLDNLIDIHSFSMEAGAAAQISSTNPSMQALAQHVALVSSFHKALLTQLRDRLFLHQSYKIYFPVPPTSGVTATPSATETTSATPSGTTTVEPINTPTGTNTIEPTASGTTAAPSSATSGASSSSSGGMAP